MIITEYLHIKIYRKLLLIPIHSLLTCFIAGSVFASPFPSIARLGIEQGLSNNTVRCIFRDHSGFMWFGTTDGLNRFDGYDFRVFRNQLNDTNSIINNYVTCITGDTEDNIWVGTRKGLSFYNSLTGKFRAIDYLPAGTRVVTRMSAVIKEVKTDLNNNVLIGTEGIGLLFGKKGSSFAIQLPLETEKGITHNYSVKSIKFTEDHRTWVLVQDIGLCLLDTHSMRLILKHALDGQGLCMEPDGENIWITSFANLYKYNIATNSYTKVLDVVDVSQSQGYLVTLTLDRDKQIWMGTNGQGIVIYNTVTKETRSLVAGDGRNMLSSNAIYAICEDNASRKWIGTIRGGINIIDPGKSRFETIQHDPAVPYGLNSNLVQAFYEQPDGKIWLGSEDYGVSIWNRAANTFYRLHNDPGNTGSLSQDNITSIIGDHQGTVWVATFSGGINRYDAVSGKFEHYHFNNPVNGNRNEAIYAIYEDKDHTILTGTLRQGNKYGALYCYNRATNRFDLFDKNISDLFMIREDNSGNLWGGTLDKLIKIDKVSKRHSYYNIGYPVWDICPAKGNNIWVATEGGGLLLFDFKSNRIVKRFTTGQGLCNNSLLKIIDDENGHLWISTYNGLAKFDIANEKFRNYYQSDGLQSNQFLYKAGLKLRSKELIFGGIKGFNLFNPGNININTGYPALLLTSILINGIPIEQELSLIKKTDSSAIRSISVPYNKAVFSFDFTALEYSSPAKIAYAYFLDGWDRNWNYTNSVRTANYTHVNEGSYVLHVKSTNAEGVWNPQEILLDIVVLPPWYRTWWTYLFYFSFIFSLIYLFYTYKTRQARLSYQLNIANLNREKERAEHAMERAEHEKERVIIEKEKEINEKRLSFFTNISHEFRTPLTLIINPIKELMTGGPKEADPEEVATVYRNARRLLSLVDQLLLFRKADSDSDRLKLVKLNFSHLCKEVYLCFAHQAKIKMIDYQFESSGDLLEMYVDREKIEIALFNLLSNALKFTPEGGKIRFNVQEMAETVHVTVSDTGRGISKEVGDNLWKKFYQPQGNYPAKGGFGIGLFLVKHFTESHKGTVAYKSTEGKGTVFTLTLLKGKQHFSRLPVFEDVEEESIFLQELQEESMPEAAPADLTVLVTEQQTILVIDDDNELRKYMAQLFAGSFTVLEASNGEEGLKMAENYLPDIIISDISMQGMNGIELCTRIKENTALSHIPVVLLTASTGTENKLKGIESGADDYIIKPFEKELLKAKVTALLKKRNTLQEFFYNEITLKKNDLKVSVEYKEFLNTCIRIVESHLEDDQFSIKTMAREIGMSHSSLYKKVKSVSGQSIKGFIRFIRLRKAAEYMINTEHNITQIASMVGFNDIKYFREHFMHLFSMKPSEYIRKFRKPFHNTHKLNKKVIRE